MALTGRSVALICATALLGVPAAGCGEDENDPGLQPVVTETVDELQREAEDAKRKARQLKKQLERDIPSP
jgi:hypothetical protein